MAVREPSAEPKRQTTVNVSKRVLSALLAAASIIVGAQVVATDGTAYACSCDDISFAEFYEAFPGDVLAAFVGAQTDRVVEDEFADAGAELLFEVDEVYAGEVATEYRVRTAAQSSACGIDLANAGTVGVVVFEFRGRPTVGLCGSVVPIDELAAVFGPATEPLVAPPDSQPTSPSATTAPSNERSDDSNGPARLALIGLLVVIVAAGIGFALRQRRS